jgi:TonB family protein
MGMPSRITRSAILRGSMCLHSALLLLFSVAFGTTNALGQTSGDERVAKELYLTRTLEKYPKAAEDAGIEGVVLLEVQVDTNCTISSKRVVDGPDHGLHEAALNLVDKQFELHLIRDLKQCSPGSVLIPVRFRLTR